MSITVYSSWPARTTGPASAPTASRPSLPQLPPWRCRPESRRQVPAARPGLSRIWAGKRPGHTPRWTWGNERPTGREGPPPTTAYTHRQPPCAPAESGASIIPHGTRVRGNPARASGVRH